MKKKLLWLLLVLQGIFFLPWGLGQIILAYSSALAKRTKTQVVVLTVPTLDGESIEDYGLSVLREWGIGDKKENNGVLLLVATKDRKSRIEVGYGLEGVLPDGLTGRIQDQYMLPALWRCHLPNLALPFLLSRRWPRRWLWRGRRLRWRQFWRRLRWGRRFQS